MTLNTIQMKKTLLAVFLLLFTYLGFTQAALRVSSNEKGLFVTHTVAPKENFYSIGRLYFISPKEIAAFNNIDMTHGLSIGQKLMVPLNAGNFSQNTQQGTPVVYVVGDGEGLMKVSQKNNNVLLSNLRQWNNLTSDVVTKGTSLIVGYVNATTGQTSAPVVKNEAPKQEPVAAKQEPKQTPTTEVAEKKPEPVAEKKPDPVVIQTKEAATKPVPSNVSNQQVTVSGAGYFKTQYDQQNKKFGSNKDLTVTSGIFKTASGWQDAKYYALMDNVEPGTIVRIVNPDNNKVVFAKVLGEISGIRQNQGLEVRISNSAASALNVADTDKFIVKVNY
jgi:LysM repeat protein